MRRFTVGVLLALFVVSGAFAAGADEAEDSGDVPGTISFSVFAPIFDESPLGAPIMDLWYDMMEDHLGVELDITWNEYPRSEQEDRQSLYMAAGDYDDIISIQDRDLVNEAGEAGLLVNLAENRSWIPNYQVWLDEKENNLNAVTAGDGGVYAFAYGNLYNYPGTQWAFMARFDIFKEHGLEPPSSLDELYEVARELKEIYPDSYPLGTAPTARWGNLQKIMMVLHRMDLDMYWNGDEWRMAPVQDADRYREVLAYLNKLYEEELLEPEFFTQSNDLSNQRAITGRYFMIANTFIGRQYSIYNASPEYPDNEWGLIRHPINIFEEVPHKMGTAPSGRVFADGGEIAVSADTEYPELLTKLVDKQYSDEWIELSSWGIEGETYQVVDGRNRFLPILSEAEDAGVVRDRYAMTPGGRRPGIQMGPIDKEAEFSVNPENNVYADGEYFSYNGYLFYAEYSDPDTTPPVAPEISWSAEEREFIAANLTPIQTSLDENSIRFIVGDRSLDEYDDFVAELERLGDVQGLVDIYNERSR